MSQRSRFHGGLKGHHSQGRQGAEPAGPGAWWQRQLRTLTASGKAPIKWLALSWGLLGACVSPWVPSPALPERRGGHSGRHTGCQNAQFYSVLGTRHHPFCIPRFLSGLRLGKGHCSQSLGRTTASLAHLKLPWGEKPSLAFSLLLNMSLHTQ